MTKRNKKTTTKNENTNTNTNTDTTEEETKKRQKSVVPESYKRAYGKAGNCGDQVVDAMAEAQASGTTLEAIATENGVDFGRWSHLNNGMQRMNLGNVLRGLCRKEEVEVRIGTWTNTVTVA